MTITLQNLVSAAALLGVFFAYSQFRSQKREASVKKDVHKREHEQLTADLASAKARLDAIDQEVQSGKVDFEASFALSSFHSVSKPFFASDSVRIPRFLASPENRMRPLVGSAGISSCMSAHFKGRHPAFIIPLIVAGEICRFLAAVSCFFPRVPPTCFSACHREKSRICFRVTSPSFISLPKNSSQYLIRCWQSRVW
jgi:hypothetical protein